VLRDPMKGQAAATSSSAAEWSERSRQTSSAPAPTARLVGPSQELAADKERSHRLGERAGSDREQTTQRYAADVNRAVNVLRILAGGSRG
jgi:hypothetical protein